METPIVPAFPGMVASGEKKDPSESAIVRLEPRVVAAVGAEHFPEVVEEEAAYLISEFRKSCRSIRRVREPFRRLCN